MIMEVAIALENAQDDSGGERKKEGDIIAVRLSGSYIGTKEATNHLWLRLEAADYERLQFDALVEAVFEPDQDTGTRYDKRRYCIPFGRLLILDPAFDVDRARDPADIYQPYLVVDEEDYTFVSSESPFQVSGLVFDKTVGDYL